MTSGRTKDKFALNLNQKLGQKLCSFKLEIEMEKKRFFKNVLAQHHIVNQTYMYSLQLIS